MNKKPTTKTGKKIVKAYLIKNKTCDNPWSLRLSHTENDAWETFEEVNIRFSFKKEIFEIIPCTITYKLPLTK